MPGQQIFDTWQEKAVARINPDVNKTRRTGASSLTPCLVSFAGRKGDSKADGRALR